ncbi:HNH endonuclease [Micromonospora sp. NPDC049751]|uniref:HNH endonuclease n=1 Tax=Micromonospora sp. NPDC049751 TaxID=3154837 RepID=UPI0033D0AE5D
MAKGGRAAGKAGAGIVAKLVKPLAEEADEVAAAAAKAVRKDSRGRIIPDGVDRLPSGRLPSNFEWAGKKYEGKYWTPKLQEKYPDGVWFTDDGYPDFGPYIKPPRSQHEVHFDPHFEGNHGSDFTDANRKAGLPATPEGHTWHHHQDTKRMQLVPSDLHDAVKHAGGVSIMKGRT